MKIAVAGGTGTVGRYVVEAAERAGHEVAILSRSTRVDLFTGEGLDNALDDAEVIIDTVNAPRTSRAKATAFFLETTQHLQTAGAARSVDRLITLSIVGLMSRTRTRLRLLPGEARTGGGCATMSDPGFNRPGHPVPRVLRPDPGPHSGRTFCRSSADEDPADRSPDGGRDLGGCGCRPSKSQAVEVAGPEPADLIDLVRALIAHRGQQVAVIPLRVPGGAGQSMKGGALIPTPDVRIVGPTFAQWLDSPDSASSKQ